MPVTHWTALHVALTLARDARPSASPKTDKVLENVRLPTGFKLEVYADNVPGARSMALGQRGTLFVGTRGATASLRRQRHARHRRKPTVRVLADKLNMPNGVAFRDGALYVAEINRILRYDAIESSLDKCRSRRSCATTCRRTAITAGGTSRSVPTASSTCRSARRAMFATSRSTA